MRWRTKSIAQQILSKAPGGKAFYYYLQKRIGGFRDYSITPKLSQGLRLISALDSFGYQIQKKQIFEIGTGWSPIIPMLFYILGQRTCYTYDINELLKTELCLDTAEELACAALSLESEVKDYKDSINHERLLTLTTPRSLAGLLKALNINYFAPADARTTHLMPESIDIAFSNTTLEHIPESHLGELFLEMKRILSKDGVMIHLVDCSDHYSHSDKSISAINFLQFSDQEWAQHNNAFLFQNRLRPNSYKRLAEGAGFDVTIVNPHFDEESLRNLPSFPLHERFVSMSPEEICTTSFILIGKPKT